MIQVKILGTGCAKCNQLADAVQAAIAADGIVAEVEKVQDIQQIMSYNVLSTPALVVDGEVRSAGRVPSADELHSLLRPKAKGCCCKGSSGSSCC
ncbi:MAG: redox-active disulfide protein 2 [Pelodictyon luteolum]|uniref:Redox-active disulfide protein 2 n=1 Tax=Pelodictyon luteolum TaxID=1100 RepID=A0A165L541_PELLU|nr:thioredoxin family protein [Pelodictyon luteolum]KZK73580.1 MAG: redox-active disulfide protein 2 [Pelodictyon luteolum]